MSRKDKIESMLASVDNVESYIDNLSIQDIELILGLDKIEPIRCLTPSDEKSVAESAEYFRPMYEEELRDRLKEIYSNQ